MRDHVLKEPPPAAQFALTHAVAAKDAAARVANPEPLPLPIPLRQLALQPYVVTLFVLEVPPPAAQFALTHAVAAADAAARVASPEPLSFPVPLRQLALQPYVVTLFVLEVPPP